MNFRLATALALMFVIHAGSLGADPIVLYSTLAPDGTYVSGSTWAVGGSASTFGSDYDVAASFTPSQDATLVSIAVALSYLQGTNAVDLSLRIQRGRTPGSDHRNRFPIRAATILRLVGHCSHACHVRPAAAAERRLRVPGSSPRPPRPMAPSGGTSVPSRAHRRYSDGTAVLGVVTHPV